MTLGKIGDPATVPALRTLLNDESEARGETRLSYKPPQFKQMTVHEAALQALERIRPAPEPSRPR